MKVKDLIRELRKFDKNDEVMVYTMMSQELLGYTKDFTVSKSAIAASGNLDMDDNMAEDVEAVILQ